MTSTGRNRLMLLGALLVAGTGLAFVSFGNLGQNLVYYWSPGELLSQGAHAYHATIRLGGIVQTGSLQWEAGHSKLHFRVADGKTADAKSVPVFASETPPQMFREGIGVVVEGHYDKSGIFTSDRLMVNHSNEYRAPKNGEKPGDWKKSLASSSPETPRAL